MVSVEALVSGENVNWTTGFSFVFWVSFLGSLNALLFPFLYRSMHAALTARSAARAVGWGLLSSLVLLASGLGLGGWSNWCADAVLMPVEIYPLLTCALLTPFILALIPRIIDANLHQRKIRQEWERLEIEEA